MCEFYKNGQMIKYDCGRAEHGFGTGIESTITGIEYKINISNGGHRYTLAA